MGNKGVISKNYIMNYIPDSLYVKGQPGMGFADCYNSHQMPELWQKECYDMRAQKTIRLSEMTDCVHSRPRWISLLTYNVWFEIQTHSEDDRRQQRIFDLSARGYPILHILTAYAFKAIALKQDILHIFDKYESLRYLDFIKIPLPLLQHPFSNSTMRRSMLTAILQFANPNYTPFTLSVNNVHLESLNHPQRRIEQLEQINLANSNADMQIIAGDFNFTDGMLENRALQGYSDIWWEGKKHFSQWANPSMIKKGHTMPDGPKFRGWRPDHIMVKRTQRAKEQDQIAIVGDFTIPPYEDEGFQRFKQDGIIRTPSDHFALLAKIHL